MKVDKETLHKIAHLARLEFDPAEEKKMLEDLNNILTWIEKLDELDTKEVKPLIHLSAELNSFREDEVNESLDHKKGLLNAPKKDSDYFRVPKVVE